MLTFTLDRADPIVIKVVSFFGCSSRTQLVFRDTAMLPNRFCSGITINVQDQWVHWNGAVTESYFLFDGCNLKSDPNSYEKNVTQTLQDSYYVSITKTGIWSTPWKNESYRKYCSRRINWRSVKNVLALCNNYVPANKATYIYFDTSKNDYGHIFWIFIFCLVLFSLQHSHKHFLYIHIHMMKIKYSISMLQLYEF